MFTVRASTVALALALVLALGPLPVVAAAQDAPAGAAEGETPGGAETAADKGPAETSARTHHEQGRLQFSVGKFDAAIAEFRKAYELKADPSFLYDIAEAYRVLGAPGRAVFFYRKYLSTHPSPPNQPEVESQIALLAPQIPGPAAPAPAPPALIARPGLPEVDLRTDARTDVAPKAVPARRFWLWTAVGALAAVGATVAILAASRRGEDAPPSSGLGNAKFF